MASSPPEEIYHCPPDRQAILDSFAVTANASLERSLAALQTPSLTLDGNVLQQQAKERLRSLLELQETLATLLASKIAATRGELRDQCIANSPLLSLSSEFLGHISTFLDEGGLLALEQSTRDLMMSQSAPLYSWEKQWEFLDQRRHSKSSLQTNPRHRGMQFARASALAETWEQVVHHQKCATITNEGTLALQCDSTTPTTSSGIYDQAYFAQDFGLFFRNPMEAGTPNLEFFIRLSYNNQQDDAEGSKHQNEDEGNNSDKSILLLEGFQSNFQSLRRVSDAEDEGHHTYVGVSEDRNQLVMVRNDIEPLRRYMGLDDRYFGMDSDDSELEVDEEEEFHFLQWPVEARKEFLDHVNITIVRCNLNNDVAGNNGGAVAEEDEENSNIAIVGTTTGYYDSNQHFAMFRPIELYREGVARMDHIFQYFPTPVVNIGLGCGVGESLHIVVKWEEYDFRL